MSIHQSYNEKELFEQISEGNETAFKIFYESIESDCAAYAYRLLRSWDAVKEIMQETLIRFWLYRDKLTGMEYPKAYFFRMLANECSRHLARHNFTENKMKLFEWQYKSGVDPASNQTEMDISYRETSRLVAAVVAKLPPQRQTVYKLSREAGLTLPEIAEKMGVSRDYVKKALMAALQLIRKKLREEGRYTDIMYAFCLFETIFRF